MPAGFFNNGSNSSTIVGADNVDFSGAANPSPQITADGQLLIGATASPNIRVNTLTAGTGISIINGPGSITISSTAAATDLHTARFIVCNSTAATGANYTTIQSAIDAAQGTGINQTVFIQPRTDGLPYTENLTLKAGVNLTAFVCDSQTPNVTIVGKASFSSAGTVTISGINLQTNGDNFLAVTGSAASVVNLTSCNLNATNATGISFTSSSSSASIYVKDCTGDLGATGTYYNSSSAGSLTFQNGYFTNSGASTTVSTNSAGSVLIEYCRRFDALITTSSTGALTMRWCRMVPPTNNVNITTAGSGSNGFEFCDFNSGNQACMSVGVGTTVSLFNNSFQSTAANVLTGAGTIIYANNQFTGPSNTYSTTAQTAQITRYGVMRSTKQPCFLVHSSGNQNSVTGDATTYTLLWDTVDFDQAGNFASNTFTAPYTGNYLLSAGALATNIAAGNSDMVLAIAVAGTSARTFRLCTLAPGKVFETISTTNQVQAQGSIVTSMTAGDTATVTLQVTGGTKVVNIAGGASPYFTWFSGYLIC